VAGATITQAKKKGPPSEGGRRTIREQKRKNIITAEQKSMLPLTQVREIVAGYFCTAVLLQSLAGG
jgi:hypothetical protein